MTSILFIFVTRFTLYLAAAYFSFKHNNYWVTALAVTSMLLSVQLTFGDSRVIAGAIANVLAFIIVMVALNTRGK